MESNKDDIVATIGTIIVHAVFLLLLYLNYFKMPVAEEDSGILVNFGTVYASTGMFEPQYAQRTPQVEIPPQPQIKSTPAKEELITQDEEETVALPASKKKDEKVSDENAEQRAREEAERRRIEEEKKRQEEEQKQQEEAISNLASKSFGAANSPETQQGETTATSDNQGSPFGSTDRGANEGIGGFGSFDLDGRYIGQGGLPRPKHLGQEVGKIVLDIIVTPDGNVISAKTGRGTNIDNAAMRKSAEEAAMTAKFNKINKTQNQSGTITYRYEIKQN